MRISIDSKQIVDNVVNKTKEVYECNYKYLNNKHIVSYIENSEDGDTRVIIRFNHDEVVIKKKGVTNTEMQFKKKEITTVDYRTPMGALIMEFSTSGISLLESDGSITLGLKYDIIMDGNVISNNKISINIL
ncbi:MAG: DUF1934 domain-containing protein [Lachnospiraceae bacterium]|nr:DUF1934 domain-containing protein [Lachnospiraceae bacterium]